MYMQTLKLPDNFIRKLVKTPERGMGYQTVNVILKNGKILHQYKVLNAQLLMLDDEENVSVKDIDKIEIEN